MVRFQRKPLNYQGVPIKNSQQKLDFHCHQVLPPMCASSASCGLVELGLLGDFSLKLSMILHTLHPFTSIYIHLHPFTSIYIHLHPFTSIYIHLQYATISSVQKEQHFQIDVWTPMMKLVYPIPHETPEKRKMISRPRRGPRGPVSFSPKASLCMASFMEA